MGPSSLQERDVVDLTANSDSEDEDLRRAIMLSLEESKSQVPSLVSKSENYKPPLTSVEAPAKSLTKGPAESGSLAQFLGLDRKQMEQERLARLKRKREEVSPPPLSRASATATANNQTTPQTLIPYPHRNPTRPSPTQAQQNSTSTTPLPLKYPTGRVLKTWCFGVPREHDIKLEELLDRSSLESAVLSSFIWNHDWLFPKLDTKRTKFVLVMHAPASKPWVRHQIEEDFHSIPNVRLCFPPMEGQVVCMHSKLMLLFYEGYMRMAVPTANLMPFDWGEAGGVMENMVFVIDLPKFAVSEVTEGTPTSQTAFHADLKHFLTAQTLPADVLRKVDEHDFSATASYGFVHSVGGTHASEEAWRRTGLCGLGRTVSTMKLQNDGPIQVDFVTSSVGSLNAEFMRSMYLAAQGDDGLTEYTMRTVKRFPANIGKNRVVTKGTGNEWQTNFRVYFPSAEYVQRSKGGPHQAGTICFQKGWWEGAKFPRACMRDCVSVRKGLLMHNKVLFTRFPEASAAPGDGEGARYAGWAYVGSANLSESAWGRLVQDKTTKTPKLNCKNWECGVVLPVLKGEQDKAPSEGGGRQGEAGLRRFEGTVPVPMHVPGQVYEDRQPWFFQEEI